LPDHNPAALEVSPKIVLKRGYTPTRDDIKKLLDGLGTPRGRLLAHWMFYALSRRATFAEARWPDLDLEQGTWEVVGKGDQMDIFALNPTVAPRLSALSTLATFRDSSQPASLDAGTLGHRRRGAARPAA
jgi:hypothetical protein